MTEHSSALRRASQVPGGRAGHATWTDRHMQSDHAVGTRPPQGRTTLTAASRDYFRERHGNLTPRIEETNRRNRACGAVCCASRSKRSARASVSLSVF